MELGGPQRRIPVLGAPSASAAAEPPAERDCAGYNLYRIESGSGGWRCEAIWRGPGHDADGIIEIKGIGLIDWSIRGRVPLRSGFGFGPKSKYGATKIALPADRPRAKALLSRGA